MYVFTKGDVVVGITNDANGIPDFDKTYVFDENQTVILGNTVQDGVVINKDGMPSYCVSKLSFINRFTLTELATIEAAASSDPVIKVLQRQQEIADFIDLQDAKTAQGVGYLVSIGLITPERMTEILTVQ